MTNNLDIDSLVGASRAFKQELTELKAANPLEDSGWYGYDSLANCEHLNSLLGGANRRIFETVRSEPLADIGGADGDVGFLLERHGFDVDLIDWPPTNWNNLRGAERLRQLLDARVSIHALDLDSYFVLPRDRYGLVLFLGILYHLKNPFYVLERLAMHSRYCLVSSKVARFTADRRLELAKAPVAYLLDPDECNNDPTNFWIFSVLGLKRLFSRTGWEVLEFMTVGDTQASNPSAEDHDERAFALLRSRHTLL